MQFVGEAQLTVTDMRLLQVLIALAGLKGSILSSSSKLEMDDKLRKGFKFNSESESDDVAAINPKLSELLREMGYATDNQRSRDDLKESLARMSGVSIIFNDHTRRSGFQLLSYVVDAAGSLHVALNPALSQSVFKGSHTRISLNEIRALKTGPARLMHQRLCAWVDVGRSRNIGLDNLCSYAWPEEATASTMRQRRKTARTALVELAGLGWDVAEYAKNKYSIRRPAHKT